MSQADELLNSLETPEPRLMDTGAEPHIVIGADRMVTVPDELKRIAVQFDHNVETVTFDCPRYWDGLDMSEMKIFVNYQRSDKAYGCYPIEDVVVDEADDTLMHFDWTLSQNATLTAGKLTFLVCVRKADEDGNQINHWNSELCDQMTVSPGMEAGDAVIDQYPDFLNNWNIEIEVLKKALLDARLSGEFDGATFTPYVDETGNLSWSNDKGLPNPPNVNLAAAHDHNELYAPKQHDHSASNITSGTLPVERGGTGVGTTPSLLVNLASESSAGIFASAPRPGVTGALPVKHGGTGNTSVDTTPTSGSNKMVTSGGVYTALAGKAASSHTHDISDVTNLQTTLDGKAPAYTYGTEDIEAGSASPYETGHIHFVYE